MYSTSQHFYIWIPILIKNDKDYVVHCQREFRNTRPKSVFSILVGVLLVGPLQRKTDYFACIDFLNSDIARD